MFKVVSEEYELARRILLNLMQKGLISKAEFDVINKENYKVFIEEKTPHCIAN